MSNQTSNILSRISASRTQIILKFKLAVQVATLTSDKFTLSTIEATPTEFDFREIVINDDYNSISRELIIHFDGNIPSSAGDYNLTIEGIRSASGILLPTETIRIPYQFDNEDVEPVVEETTPPPTVQDKSIKADLDFGSTSTSYIADSEFYVSSVDPEGGSIFVEQDHNDGLVSIEFSGDPQDVTDSDFKVQRKKLADGINRWEAVNFSSSASGSTVEIQFEDIGSGVYFENGYKYRIIPSKTISDADDVALGTSPEIVFATEASPLYIDPEEFMYSFPEASLVEIMEVVRRFSAEASHITGESTPTLAMYEYIRAAVECHLLRTYDSSSISGGGKTMTLGDLTIADKVGGSQQKGVLNRGNAMSPCEIASVLRQELVRTKGVNIRSVVTGTRYPNPMPRRHLKPRG